MINLGKLIRLYIERSGYTIYGIAKRADINRTTLQKILSGDRFPSQEFMEKLLPILKLTPAEYAKLLSFFEMQQAGETLYQQRQYIRELLEFVSVIDYELDFTSSLGESLRTYTSQNFSGRHIIKGSINVEHIVKELMMEERTRPNPAMQINIPGYTELIRQLFIYCAQYRSFYHNLHIQHLTCFLKCPGDSPVPFINLNVLANVLPFICLPSFKYDIHYYYDNQIFADQDRTAFPYYLLFSDTILFLSADCKTAFLCKEPEMVQHFRNLFESSFDKAIPMITTCGRANDILSHLIRLDDSGDPLYSIEYQPCLVTYMTDAMLHTYANRRIPDYENSLSAICYRAQQLRGLSEKICVFSKTGLLDFTESGRISDIPESYMAPVNAEDRMILLKELYKSIETDCRLHRMVNPLTFPISERLTILLHKDTCLDFNYLGLSNASYSYIHLTEGTLVEAFSDFFPYLVQSHLVYSKEETLKFICECIGKLEGNAV